MQVLFNLKKKLDKPYVWWPTIISDEPMSTTLTIDAVTTEVSTGVTHSTFGNHLT